MDKLNLEEEILRSCRFCTKPDKNRIIYETENFYVMLSLGPITEGYSLLVTKQHIACCAAIPIEQQEEFKGAYSLTKSILNEVYGSCICYEHGRAGSCLIPVEGSKHCYHAHMHFVPINTALNSIIEPELDDTLLIDLDDLFRGYNESDHKPYLFVDDNAKMNLYIIESPIRRQYLRFKAAKSIGKEHLWDWMTHQGWEIIEAGLKVLPAYFKQSKSN